MNLSEIQDLIKFVSKSGVNEVEIEQKDFKITIKSEVSNKRRGKAGMNQQEAQAQMMQQIPMPMAQMPQQMPMQQQQPQQQAPQQQAPAQPAAKEGSQDKGGDDTSNYVEIKSPMIGTFYRSPSPDKPEFVSVGDTVKEGDVVCIVEAMKLFNEIESEVSGKIIKVLVDDHSPIEYDQPLMLVDPS